MSKRKFAISFMSFMLVVSTYVAICNCCSSMLMKHDKHKKVASSHKKCCEHESKSQNNEHQSDKSNKECKCSHPSVSEAQKEATIISNVVTFEHSLLFVGSLDNIPSHNVKNCFKANSSNSPPIIHQLSISSTVLLI